nr:putative protein C3P1 [Microcebus murinus]
MTALPYSTQDGSGNFLHIEVKTLGTEVGGSIQLSLNTRHRDPAAKDQITHFTSELKVGLKNDGFFQALEPQSVVELKVTGDAEATVGLVAVDKAVYVLTSKHKLTQKKVWDVVEEHGIGCTAGSGKDRLAVFKDARLDLKISTGTNTLASSGGHKANSVNVPDSITTWQFVAVSLKTGQGLCGSDPFELTVMKLFFVELKLPPSVVRNEQVQIQAVLYNFRDFQVKVKPQALPSPPPPNHLPGDQIQLMSHSILLDPQGQTQVELVPWRDFLNKEPNTSAEVFSSVQGYIRVLTHRSADGTYHTSKGRPGSTW